MATEWYFRSGGSVSGPYSSSELKQLAQRGVIDAITQVRRGSERNWVPAARVSGLLEEGRSSAVHSATPPPLPPTAGGDIRAAQGTAPNSASQRGLDRISLPGWAVIAASLTIIVATISVAFVLIVGKGGAATPVTIALGKSAADAPEYKKPQVTTVAETPVPAPVVAVHAPIVKQMATEPRKPDIKETRQIVSQVGPSVVTIEVSKNKVDGTGSGFVLDTSGMIVTNYHVIEGAKSARVVFHNGMVAEVLGFAAIHPGKDLAILRIDPPAGRLAPLSLARQLPSQGEKVLAFGAPRRLAGSISDGIVSAIRKGAELQDIFTKQAYCDEMGYDVDAVWIQTTAPISPGNSGGPLVNSDGEVVGVSTWSRTDGQNINFAISGLQITELVEVRNLNTRPLAELPPSRDDIRAAETERRAKRTADEARIAAATQLELTRLNDRMAVLKTGVEAIEEQGRALTAKRSECFALAAEIDGDARAVARSIAVNQAIINLHVVPVTADSLTENQEAVDRLATLREQHATLEARYNKLDAAARELKAQINALAKARDDQLHEMRGLQVQYDRMLRGPSPEAAKDAATANAWRQLARGMKTADVERLLGRPSSTGQGANGRGLMWEFKYIESGTTIGITGAVYFVAGGLVQWEQPRWAAGK
jgi:S1-C subfamily serine protease